MITFNGLNYAKNDKELVESLFNKGGTCNGFYKVVRGGIKLYRVIEGGKELDAFIKREPYNSFVVTANKEGKIPRYMFSTTSHTEKWLGLGDVGYLDTLKACQETIKQAFN